MSMFVITIYVYIYIISKTYSYIDAGLHISEHCKCWRGIKLVIPYYERRALHGVHKTRVPGCVLLACLELT